MKPFLKFSLITLSVFTFLTATAYFYWYKPKFNSNKKTSTPTSPVDIRIKEEAKLKSKAHSLKSFAASHDFNTEIGFLIDLKLESGQNRFFVYDLKKNTILYQGLVTHGRCNKQWLVGRKYGNEIGCGCSSLGKYKIGKAYDGRFGLAYKLHGLEGTNSNAYKRFVVLHSHACVPENEVAPLPICQSDGCPTVAPAFLKTLAPLLSTSLKPVLLWIVE